MDRFLENTLFVLEFLLIVFYTLAVPPWIGYYIGVLIHPVAGILAGIVSFVLCLGVGITLLEL